MKQFGSKNQKIGEFGEKIATQFLMKKEFSIIERNYTKQIGEIDIVAQKDGIIHFIEVKTLIMPVSHETKEYVSRETSEISYKNDSYYSPFQNVTRHKLRKFSRTIEWYLAERNVSHETIWVIDVIAVTVTRETKTAKVEVLWNVIG